MKKTRILIVDDERSIIEVLREALEAEGYEVGEARDGASALRRIRETIFDGALIDFHLPDMDGLALHRTIRELDDELAARSIFMSGFVQSETNLAYYTAEGSGFIAKPFRIGEVLAAVRGLLAERV